MNFKIKESSSNYTATIVKISELKDIDGADNIKKVSIMGNDVIVSKSLELGSEMIYFVSGTQLEPFICELYNLYTNPLLNADKTVKGYISPSNRIVKSIKLRGVISDGLLIPKELLESNLEVYFKEGDSFTDVDSTSICCKYERPIPKVSGGLSQKKLHKSFIENQFRFHTDTPHLFRSHVDLDKKVIITRKLHGSSCVLANVLVKKELNFIQKLIHKLFKKPNTEYAYVYSSGKPKSRMPKGIHRKGDKIGLYSNIWAKALSDNIDSLVPGISLYGELVGEGIQGRDYTYGFKEPKLFVYRITHTESNGDVVEYSWEDIKDYCKSHNLTPVKEFYSGTLNDLLKGGDLKDVITNKFLNKSYPDCKVDEGICVRVGDDIYKVKSPNFVLKETNELSV